MDSRASERITGQRQPKQNVDGTCDFLEARVSNLTMRDGLQVWRQLQNDVASKTHPYMRVALGLWWAFAVYKLAKAILRVSQRRFGAAYWSMETMIAWTCW